MSGPNIFPMRAVPRDWIAKSPARIATESGTMSGSAALVTTPTPSTAEITEIAGVMIPSPKSIAAPTTTTQVSQPAFGGT